MIKRLVMILLAILMLLSTGCTSFIREEEAENLEISPERETGNTNELTVTLYYGFNDGDMTEYIASDTRKISVEANERFEAAVLRELINGASPEKTHLFGTINPATKPVSIQKKGETLQIVLSKEFLEPTQDFPENWEASTFWVDKKNQKQRLAVYSIVNTLLITGNDYTKVEILVDKMDTEKGEAVTAAELGFVGFGNDTQVMEAMSFFEDVTVTPTIITQTILNGVRSKEWGKAYNFIYDGEEFGRPTLTEMFDETGASEYELQEFEIVDSSISVDGKSAVVNINFRGVFQNGRVIERTNVPMRMVLDNEIWKLSYASFLSIFGVE